MRFVRLTVGILMIPVCVATTSAMSDLLRELSSPSTSVLPPPAMALGGGFALWLLVYFALPRPVRSYILAHELTHALWASAMGAKVTDLKIGSESGSVTLSKSNFLITLAPYFFPLYTVLVIVAYYALSLFFAVEDYVLAWLALVGFSWGFHFTFTITTLLQHQSDIHSCGRIFSFSVIYALNLLGIAIWIVMVSPATLEQLVHFFRENMVETIIRVRQLVDAVANARILASQY